MAHDDVAPTNFSAAPHFDSILDARLTRRRALQGGLSVTTTALLGSAGLAACDNGDEAPPPVPAGFTPPKLGFVPVAKNQADLVTVPAGYNVDVLYALGDPINDATPAYANNGTDAGASFALRAGDHHDGLYFFGMNADGTPNPAASDRGLLVMNHENITQRYLHPAGATANPDGSRPLEEALREVNAHGISVIEVARTGGSLQVVRSSPRNRRITPFTEMELNGPVSGSRFAITRFSTNGRKTRGTINNCANGWTPWGTYLTCEENWAGYFRRAADDNTRRAAVDVPALSRYGLSQGAGGNFGWATVTAADAADTSFARWNASVLGVSTSGADDFRNEFNAYGYIVEIDPFDPASVPRKRTALGRFGHEGCWPARLAAGRPVVFYMGDDGRNEYIYKWVSAQNWNPADKGLAAGSKYLDDGVLYVARFNADGTGQWIALLHGINGLTADNALYPFTSQAAVAVHTRLAADSVGATKMDRPEWAAVNQQTGEVYFTLTNNRVNERPVANQDAANPRSYADARVPTGTNASGNVNGHIIRWREGADDPAATTFRWDIYLFGAQADADPATVNLSGLTDANDLSSPDGLWWDPRGVLWIQTDDGAYTDVTNCMMLAAVPGHVGDGGPLDVTSTVGAATKTVTTYVGARPTTENLRRFLVGPRQCEITGIDMTPDGKAMFVNIQHPGEDTAPNFADPATFGSHWPGIQSNPAALSRPRSATVVITRADGGVIGL